MGRASSLCANISEPTGAERGQRTQQVARSGGRERNKSRPSHAACCNGGSRGKQTGPWGVQGHRFSHQTQGEPGRRLQGDSQNEGSMQLRGWGRARQAVLPPGSGAGGGRECGSEGGLPDEAGDPSAGSGQAVEADGEDVGQDGSFGAVGLAEPGGAFHAASGLVGVAALSIALASHTQFPGGRVDFRVTSQADVAVGEREVHDDHTPQGVFRVPVGTGRG